MEPDNMEEMEQYERELEARRKKREELKRQRTMRQRIVLGGVLVVLIVIISLIFHSCSNSNGAATPSDVITTDNSVIQLPTPEPGDTNPESETGAAAVDTTTITLTAVGDIMAYDAHLNTAYKEQTDTYDFSSIFANVSKYTMAGDITVGNLETTFAGKDVGYQGKPLFNTPESLATTLSDIGFDVLSTANTYSLLHETSGLESTIKNILAAKIECAGTYYSADNRETNPVLMKNVDGINIAFIAYTKGLNGTMLPENYEYAVNVLYSDYYLYYTGLRKDALIADITAAKEKGADVIVAMTHWGSEYEDQNSAQDEVADLLFENGVDIILGSHPHILQTMEKRTVTTVDGEEKEGFICYSLGNFDAYQDYNHTNETIILNIDIQKNNVTGEISIGDIGYIPVYIYNDGNKIVLLDIHQSIADYESGDTSVVDETLYENLNDALTYIHNRAGAAYDTGSEGIAIPFDQTTADDTPSSPDVTDSGATE